MDEYLLHSDTERANDYYQLMGGLAAKALSEESIVAARYLNSTRVRNDFGNNVSAFIETQKEILDGNTSPDQKLQAMAYLQQEKSYLADQVFQLKYKKAIAIVSISIDLISEYVGYYVLRGVGIYAGYSQVVAGGALIGASYATGPGAVIGNVAGFALVLHGLGAIEENASALARNDRNYKGYLRRGYEHLSTSLGYTSNQGDILYGGIDLALSGYALSRSILLPDKGRLYYYMYNDSIVGFREMAENGSLKFEMGIDALTIKSINDSRVPSSEVKIPIPFPAGKS